MSRVKYKKIEAPLKVVNLANDLAIYTLRLLCNDKIFPRRSRWLTADKIADVANDFHTFVNMANEIRPTTREEADVRHQYQTLAMSALQTLDSKMELAAEIYQIDIDRLEYWAKMWNEEEKLLSSWISKDKRRYADM